MKIYYGLHVHHPKWLKILLTLLPFIILITIYFSVSHIKHKENPDYKLLPTFKKMALGIKKMAFEKSQRTGEYFMLKDTCSSLKRLAIGMAASAITGLLLGIHMGLFPGIQSFFYSFITFISIIPALSLLPILFITVPDSEQAKIVLIFIGTFPLICRDIYMKVKSIPKQMIIKALTLGASQLQIVYKIIMPQVLPRLIDAVRLTLGSAWLFLIAAESIESTDGLGYRIFLVRRYMAMDIIIPYVLWITFIGYITDLGLKKLVLWIYPWYQPKSYN